MNKDPKKDPIQKKQVQEPFGELVKSVNSFFNQRPVRRIMDSIDEFFAHPFPFQSIPVKMRDSGNETILSAELPGVKRDQIELEVHGAYLTITVHHSEQMEEVNENQRYYYKQQAFQKKSRTVSLPYPLKERDIKAKLQDGILEIRFPRLAKTRIDID